MSRAERAKEYFQSGYNCTQAVMLAFEDLLNLPRDTLLAVALPMGGGLGRLRQTCGALTGACMCLGLLFPERAKGEIYSLVQEAARRFRERNGSINCGELLSGAGVNADRSSLPEERSAEYYKKRPCADLAFDAAEILEEICTEQGRI